MSGSSCFPDLWNENHYGQWKPRKKCNCLRRQTFFYKVCQSMNVSGFIGHISSISFPSSSFFLFSSYILFFLFLILLFSLLFLHPPSLSLRNHLKCKQPNKLFLVCGLYKKRLKATFSPWAIVCRPFSSGLSQAALSAKVKGRLLHLESSDTKKQA